MKKYYKHPKFKAIELKSEKDLLTMSELKSYSADGQGVGDEMQSIELDYTGSADKDYFDFGPKQ